jgi:LysM repeat protein
LTRLDLKAILAILILSSLLMASACSTFLPPTLEDKSIPLPEGDTPTFPLKSLDTPTSLPTLTPTSPPEAESAYPEPLDAAGNAYPAPVEETVPVEATEAVAGEVVETEAVTEEVVATEVVAEATEEAVAEATAEATAETTPEPPVTEVITATVVVEVTETAEASDNTAGAEAESAEAVSQAPASLTEVLPPADLPLPKKYTLERGEFPYCIARRYDLNPVELMRLNYLTYNQLFRKGLVLWLPQSGKPFPGERALNPHSDVYVAQKDGETIFTAACFYGDVDPAALAAANGLPLDVILVKGQEIFAAP